MAKPDRRLIVVLAAIVLGLRPAPAQQPPMAAKPQAGLPCRVADGFTLAAVGDVISSDALAGLPDNPFRAVTGLLKNADVAYGNLENSLIDLAKFPGYPQAESGGAHLIGSPALAQDMRKLGFNVMSRANNHSADWGIEGMRATDEAADAAGIVHAGTGYNLADARAARYLQTSKGRVALISMATTVTPMSAASDPLGRIPGRPGVNVLRVTPSWVVSSEMMAGLKKMHDALPAALLKEEETIRRVMQPEAKAAPEEVPTTMTLAGVNYRVGEQAVRFAYDMNKDDLREILKAVRQGKQNSDFLIATIHAHEPENWSEEPADFLPVLAHAVIDAGADAFVGHGPHRLRAIEIYKGKPIFYSLGNFVFQQAIQEPMPPDVYESLQADPAAVTDHELIDKGLQGWFDSPVWYRSIVAVSRFEQGRLAEIRLHPIDLGYSAAPTGQGVPRLAGPEVARAILEELRRLSKPFGTTLEVENGTGIIRFRGDHEKP
jgi:poly-gamma-glutamate capsule biosynthesis protein CapA/YwtB (metallophosphatase superfamily)